jgi:hypothetical protein
MYKSSKASAVVRWWNAGDIFAQECAFEKIL